MTPRFGYGVGMICVFGMIFRYVPTVNTHTTSLPGDNGTNVTADSTSHIQQQVIQARGEGGGSKFVSDY